MPPHTADFTDTDDVIASNQYHPNVEWRWTEGKGRGVFAKVPLQRGAVVEWAPVYVFPAADLKTPDKRPSDYAANQLLRVIFWYDDDAPEGPLSCIALGNLSLYNHADAPNVDVVHGPVAQSLAIVALRDIAAGEELCFDYGITWF
jgi:SET domain-containing protein